MELKSNFGSFWWPHRFVSQMSWSQIRWPGLCILMRTSSEMHLSPKVWLSLRQLLFPRERVIGTHRKDTDTSHSFLSHPPSHQRPQSPCPDSSHLGFIEWACLLGTHHSDAGTHSWHLLDTHSSCIKCCSLCERNSIPWSGADGHLVYVHFGKMRVAGNVLKTVFSKRMQAFLPGCYRDVKLSAHPFGMCLAFADNISFPSPGFLHHLFYVSGTHATAHMWRSEDSFQELAFSTHHVGPRDWTWVVELGSKLFYLRSHVTSLQANVLKAFSKYMNSRV